MASARQTTNVVVGLVVLFVLLTVSMVLADDRASAPDSPNALWVTSDDGALKLAAEDGEPALKISFAGGKLESTAVDAQTGDVWLYGRNRLEAYTAEGAQILSVDLPREFGRGSSGELLVDSAGGNVWLARRDKLYRLNLAGGHLGTIDFRRHIQALTLNAEASRLWVAAGNELTVLDQGGNTLGNVKLARNKPIYDMAWSPELEQTWVSLRGGLRRYDGEGNRTFSKNYRHRMFAQGGKQAGPKLAVDGKGDVWLSSKQFLAHVDQSGLLEFVITPFSGQSGSPLTVDIAANPQDQSVWAASRARLKHYSVDSQLLHDIDMDSGSDIRSVEQLELYADVEPPTLQIDAPEEGAFLDTLRPQIELSYFDEGSGIDPHSLRLEVDDVEKAMTCEAGDLAASCTPDSPFAEEGQTLTVTVADRAGNESEPAEVFVILDVTAPAISLQSPPDGLITNQSELEIRGSVSEAADLTFNGEPLSTDATHSFDKAVMLTEGPNDFTLRAVDLAGNTSEKTLSVTLDTVPPAEPTMEAITIEDGIDPGTVRIQGGDGAVEAGAKVTVTNTSTGESHTVTADELGAFTAVIGGDLADTYELVVHDDAGNASPVTQVTGGTEETPTDPAEETPPDPADVAPPLPRTEASPMIDRVAFLFTGSDPIQKGVEHGTIEARRVSMLHGRVLNRAGDALPGVRITVLNHPELGVTHTQADGDFDMAVNGGEDLTVTYNKDGYLPVQRTVATQWNDWFHINDVVMIPLSEKVTTIDLADDSEPIQVARGEIVTDADGSRQATLLFPSDVSAELRLPDGSRRPLTELAVRATEYTVGENGPDAMPGNLPTESGYTYAVELSVDQALAAGATTVAFDQPVPTYVDNFLNFPVGTPVPAGFYDRGQAAWVASDDGRVVKIMDVVDGMAQLDLDGSGTAADAEALASLGITDAERLRLASLYAPGQSLWRVPIPHLTPWDYNWPYGPPPDATPPNQPEPVQDEDGDGDADGHDDERGTENSCEVAGSIIGCQSLTVGESIPVASTSFALNYQSKRLPGRTIGRRSMSISLSGDQLPLSLQRIDLEIRIAGREIKKSFPAEPNQSYTFVWDGKDGWGRTVQGSRVATIRIGYVYPAVYYRPGVTTGGSSGGDGDSGGGGGSAFSRAFGRFGDSPLSANEARGEIISWQEHRKTLGAWDATGIGLGGWSPDAHHAYDPGGGVLYRGDGSQRSAENINEYIISTLAPEKTLWPAELWLFKPRDVAVGPDGSIYVVDGREVVRRLGPDGEFTAFAGNGESVHSGDGGAATEAGLDPHRLAVEPNGDLLIVSNNRVRHVDADGIITTVAGNGEETNSGDGGPAVDAGIDEVMGIAAHPDGGVVIATNAFFLTAESYLRRVGSDGIITTIAGIGRHGHSGDGGPAREARIDARDVAVGPEGAIFLIEYDRVRRIGRDGIIQTIAGGGDQDPEGVPATEARLSNLRGMAVGPQGDIFVTVVDASHNAMGILRIDAEGIIDTIAGGGPAGLSGDGGLATKAQLNQPLGVAVSPDDTVFVADNQNDRIRRLDSAVLPGGSGSQITIASADGRWLYEFNQSGRHLRSFNALTGATRFEFRYDDEGRLVEIKEPLGENANLTTIERDAQGLPTAIVASFGQRTEFALDENDYLSRITDPAGASHEFAYLPTGLLTSHRDPRGNLSSYAYDPEGRLTRAEDPADGVQIFERSEDADGFTVTRTTALGRQTRYRVEHLDDGGIRHITTFPDGSSAESVIETTGDRTVTYPDGRVVSLETGPDPRWGMQAPVIERLEITTPDGLTSVVTADHQVTLEAPGEPLSIKTSTTRIQRNGRTYETVFDAAAGTVTRTSPGGRKAVTVLDAQGRIIGAESPGEAPVTIEYDESGRIASLTQSSADGTGEALRAVNFDFDANGNLASMTDPLGQTLGLGYDAAGRLIRQTLPDGREIAYERDANGNPTSLTPPGGETHNIAYTPRERVADYSPPALSTGPTVSSFSYDADGQVDQYRLPDGRVLDFAYDTGGRPTQIHAPRGALGLDYDIATGNLARVTAPDGGAIERSYDGPLLTGTQWLGTVAGSVTRQYDADFRVASRSVNGAHTAARAYNVDGLPVQAGELQIQWTDNQPRLAGTQLGGVATDWVHKQANEVDSYTASHEGTELYRAEFEYDATGRITQRLETVAGISQGQAYIYDDAGRLSEVRQDGRVMAAYTYDANGNRLTETGPDKTVHASYDAQDRLVAYGSTEYAYNSTGQLTAAKDTDAGTTTAYDYDVFGNLMLVALPDGTDIDYTVDGLNRRIGKSVNGSLVQGFLYQDAINPVAELNAAGDVVARFVYATRPHVPDYMIKDGSTYRLITDRRGSVRLVVDVDTGTVAQRLDYDAFGNLLTDTNPGFQPFGFAGGLYDRDTGLLRFGARDYDPRIGRWTAKDPLWFGGGSANLYTYAWNDPINYVDPDGKFAFTGSALLGAALFGAISSAAADTVSQLAANDGDWSKVDPGRVAISAGVGGVTGLLGGPGGIFAQAAAKGAITKGAAAVASAKIGASGAIVEEGLKVGLCGDGSIQKRTAALNVARGAALSAAEETAATVAQGYAADGFEQLSINSLLKLGNALF